jgi:hypothetical protein
MTIWYILCLFGTFCVYLAPPLLVDWRLIDPRLIDPRLIDRRLIDRRLINHQIHWPIDWSPPHWSNFYNIDPYNFFPAIFSRQFFCQNLLRIRSKFFITWSRLIYFRPIFGVKIGVKIGVEQFEQVSNVLGSWTNKTFFLKASGTGLSCVCCAQMVFKSYKIISTLFWKGGVMSAFLDWASLNKNVAEIGRVHIFITSHLVNLNGYKKYVGRLASVSISVAR